jgi:hypothetical protein
MTMIDWLVGEWAMIDWLAFLAAAASLGLLIGQPPLGGEGVSTPAADFQSWGPKT